MRWDGQGCSISQASVSVLHDLVVGNDLATVDQIGGTFRALMQTRGAGLDDDAEETLGDATAFTGVAKYPARIKCALLGWAALTDALHQDRRTGELDEHRTPRDDRPPWPTSRRPSATSSTPSSASTSSTSA